MVYPVSSLNIIPAEYYVQVYTCYDSIQKKNEIWRTLQYCAAHHAKISSHNTSTTQVLTFVFTCWNSVVFFKDDILLSSFCFKTAQDQCWR